MLEVIRKETIKCPKCGHDTGLPKDGPIMMVIPYGGLKCLCRTILIKGTEIKL